MQPKFNCAHCEAQHTKNNIKKHQKSCKKNPDNFKICPICSKQFVSESVTCSYSCANTFFKSGPNNPNWKESAYQTTCFHYHKKECVICGEINIVEAHHLDENKDNNDPSNLIPLCPTHHQYWHSSFKHLVEQTILEYIEDWSRRQDSNLRRPRPERGGLAATPRLDS